MEPRNKESAQVSPAGAGEDVSSGGGINRRTLGALIGIGLLVVVCGVVASGALAGPAADLLGGTDGSAAEGVPNEAFASPINSTALREAHRERLNASGSFTVVEEYKLERTSVDGPSRDYTRTSSFDLGSDQTRVEISTADFQIITYSTGTETYERIERPSGDTQYRIPDEEIGAEPYLDSNMLAELATMEVDHRETDEGHVYTASGVEALTDGFLDADVDSFRSFEFRAVVSDQGVLSAYSFEVELEDSGEILTITQSVEVTEVGSTTVQDPPWLDEARAATE